MWHADPNYPQNGIAAHWAQGSGTGNPTSGPTAFFDSYEQAKTRAPLSAAEMPVQYYDASPSTQSTSTGCCGCAALRPLLAQHQGHLRALNSTSAGHGSRRQFCAPCAKAASQAVEMNFGLRIRDDANGAVYQSHATVRAVKMRAHWSS